MQLLLVLTTTSQVADKILQLGDKLSVTIMVLLKWCLKYLLLYYTSMVSHPTTFRPVSNILLVLPFR